MKIHAKNPLTAASVAGSLLFFLASAGTQLFADEWDDYDYTPPSRKTTATSATESGSYGQQQQPVQQKQDNINSHVALKFFYGIALEDDIIKGYNDSLDIYGFSFEWAHALGKKPQETCSLEFVARFDFGYGNDDFSWGSYSAEYTAFLWNLTAGVNFVVDTSVVRLSFGPRFGGSATYFKAEYSSSYYGYHGSDDDLNAGFVFGGQAELAFKFSERHALLLDLGYFQTTAVPSDCENQSFMTFAIGYKHMF